MNVLNIHKRIVNEPIKKLAELFETLATDTDLVWPTEKWPAIQFKSGIQVGAKGGHGPIRYVVEKYEPNKIIQFRFSGSKGFDGIHKFEIIELDANRTQIQHTLDMCTTEKGTLIWLLAIRSLHNALIEDAFDKAENNFSTNKKSTQWSLWVKMVRKVMPRKRRG